MSSYTPLEFFSENNVLYVNVNIRPLVNFAIFIQDIL